MKALGLRAHNLMRLKITEAGEHERTEAQKHKYVERHGDEGTHKSIFSKNDQWRLDTNVILTTYANMG